MKILHVLYSGLGGHGNVFFSLVTADKNKEFNYEALFIGIEDVLPGYMQKCNSLGIKYHFIKKLRGLDTNFYKAFLKVIKDSNADILFLHSSSYLLPAVIANTLSNSKKKIIIRETQANNLKTKQNWFWLSMSFLFADKIVFLSREFKNEIKKKLNILYRKRKVAVIPNGIDLTFYKPLQKNMHGEITIGMQSRLTANKDHTTLVEAFALLKSNGYNNIKLKIAGDGPCKPELLMLAQKLNIQKDVEFTGMLAEEKLVEFLQNIDIYIHASYGETMSTAIMQAMACGLPIIASDVPGINNMIVANQTGILVPLKNASHLAEAIKELLDNNSLSSTLSENAFNFAVQNYSNLIMLKKYKELFYS